MFISRFNVGGGLSDDCHTLQLQEYQTTQLSEYRDWFWHMEQRGSHRKGAEPLPIMLISHQSTGVLPSSFDDPESSN